MNWSISFEPLVSWPLFWVVIVPLALLALAGLWFRQRGSVLRFIALLALGAALLNPVFLDEEREALKSVVAVIVDRSQSQDIGDVEAGKSEAADERTETRLFGALESAFRDVPPSRIGGAIMITDGEVHDAPAGAPEFNAPLHALITGNEHEKDRRI
ncbi:MAG: hypothetical protein E5W41_06120, partial [Mesorhizobium sp.]